MDSLRIGERVFMRFVLIFGVVLGVGGGAYQAYQAHQACRAGRPTDNEEKNSGRRGGRKYGKTLTPGGSPPFKRYSSALQALFRRFLRDPEENEQLFIDSVKHYN